MYDKMPFGLMNAGATFQRAMDIAFVGENGKCVVIYQDDITVFSKPDEDHLKHLRQIFIKLKVLFIIKPKEVSLCSDRR